MRETWYVLENGETVDPIDVAPDEKGALRHKSGVAVAMKNLTPVSRGVDDADAARKKAAAQEASAKEAAAKAADEKARADAAKKASAPAAAAKDIKQEDQKPGYVTRESKVQ
jgi:hypothetical protein